MTAKTIKINQEWLVWARKSLKYTTKQAGKKLRIKPENITNGKNRQHTV